jgi:virginiamycin A acetyltransferase
MAENPSTDPSRSFVVELGREVRIPFDSILKCSKIVIGDYTRINGPINIRGSAQCRIGKYCAFGYGIHILTTNHETAYPNLQIALNRRHGFINLEKSERPVVIGSNVWLGDEVMVMSGVQIGDGAVVGAGSVVTKDIFPFAVVYGVPAKVAGYRFSKAVIDQLLEISWWSWPEDKIARNRMFFETDLSNYDGPDLKDLIQE